MARTLSRLEAVEERYVKELRARRAEIAAEIEAVERKLSIIGPAAQKARPTQAKEVTGGGGRPLRVYVKDVLTKAAKPMKVRAIEQAVLKAGYKTQAKKFYHAIYTLLRQDPDVRKVGRGRFALK